MTQAKMTVTLIDDISLTVVNVSLHGQLPQSMTSQLVALTPAKPSLGGRIKMSSAAIVTEQLRFQLHDSKNSFGASLSNFTVPFTEDDELLFRNWFVGVLGMLSLHEHDTTEARA